MKRRITAIIAAFVLLICAGCAGGKQDKSENPDSTPPEPGQTDISDAQKDEPMDEPTEDEWSEQGDWRLSYPAYRSAEEAANSEYVSLYPFFILHDGWFYHLKPTRMTYSDCSNSSESPAVGALLKTPEELPVLSLSEGDKLVTFSADNDYCDFVPLENLGACLPIAWSAGVVRQKLDDVWGTNTDFVLFPSSLSLNPVLVTEIQGQTFTPYTGTSNGIPYDQYQAAVQAADAEFLGVLDSLGIPYFTVTETWNNGGGVTHYTDKYIMLGSYGDIITLGQYQETQYVESTFTLRSTLYELYLDGMITMPVTPTHDGYFEVEIPDGASGIYGIQNHENDQSVSCDAFSIS